MHTNLDKYLFFHLTLFLSISPCHYMFLKSMLSKGFIVFHYNDYSTIYLTARIVAYLNSFQLLLNHIVVSIIVHISLCSSPIEVIKFVFIYIHMYFCTPLCTQCRMVMYYFGDLEKRISSSRQMWNPGNLPIS